jgi:NADPH:quinone reductase-like Zn-dependent oxidoreductase
VRQLGADHVLDYRQDDFTRHGIQYDLIFDVLGKGSFAQYRSSLTPHGRYLLASFKLKQVGQMVWTSLPFSGGQKVICALAGETRADLLQVKALVEAGHIKAVLDRTFPLAQAAEAHRYVESGQKKGCVVLTLGD